MEIRRCCLSFGYTLVETRGNIRGLEEVLGDTKRSLCETWGGFRSTRVDSGDTRQGFTD